MELNVNDLSKDSPLQVSAREDGVSWLEWGKALVALGLAVYFLINIITGDLTNYINTRFAWLSYVAVILFALIGVASLVGILRRDWNNRTSDHTVVSWSMILVMAIPLMLGTLVPSQPLGADAVDSISLRTTALNSGGSVARDPLDRNVLDWLRVFSGSTTPSDYDGTPADFAGFIYTEPDFPDNTVMVARFTVSCCVADASAIGIPVYWPDAATLEDGVWVQVQGSFEAAIFRDVKTPILQVETLDVIDQPDHPYLYP